MQIKIKYVLLIFVFVIIAITGCEKDNSSSGDGNIFSDAEIIGYDIGDDCRQHSSTTATADGLVIHIHNIALFGMSKDSVIVRLEVLGDTLKLTEMCYQSHFDDSICYFDVSTDIQVYVTGTYWIQIFRGVNDGAIAIDWYGTVAVSGN
ncbi:hypothetical protein J7L68_06265 [bacterium]|nr:hypothetical protein [bacterium]